MAEVWALETSFGAGHVGGERAGQVLPYPVDDGEGGGAVFTDNASAHEYSLHLERWKKVEGCSGAPPPCNWGTMPSILLASAGHHHHNLEQRQQQWPELIVLGLVHPALGLQRGRRRLMARWCYARRGLSCHGDISSSVMRQYNKTIACAQNDWHLPLGGQTEGKAKNLKEAVGLAYEGVVEFDTRVFRCVTLLGHNVETGTAHVLCCRESPSAKPAYYIFEDSSRPPEGATLQFTDDYLQNERRKFTGLTYVTQERSMGGKEFFAFSCFCAGFFGLLISWRCKDCFANTPHDLKGYTGEATHNTFSIPFKDESKDVYQMPRKYSPGEQEIIDIHCKELLEYGLIEPALPNTAGTPAMSW
ncbi:hypothetical protein CYMTET_5165 [Cymbomonas tetramitiformis]|uniref:Uncharacterized protein n=1 Tax=Cymbomonas tetramitiformis TaxID=36881 RepID=A0AAE0GZX9_9CHLO|nr:hypothetical protein CYMTET_5165 [Cymbomonas tetramitiformis]